MRMVIWIGLLAILQIADPLFQSPEQPSAPPIEVGISLVNGSEVDLRETIDRLASATNLVVPRPASGIRLPVVGGAGSLGRKMLSQALGLGTEIRVEKDRLIVTLAGGSLANRENRLLELSKQADLEAKRQAQYGLRALKSYRPNDKKRPTICLVHGMNSSSQGFVHMIKPLQEAGFGIVIYDYPFNRDLRENCDRFARDLKAFRAKVDDRRDWVLVGHSMGCLVARDYVEGPTFANDVDHLIMIGPCNQGSSLAKTQTLLQFLDGVKIVGGQRASDALSKIGDGLGEAATDISPGSPFLKDLNRRPRRAGVAYHIIAGDRGVLTATYRKKIEDQVASTIRQGGVFGNLTRIAIGNDLSDLLDEISDGTGDGCVSVARSRLAGVKDHVTIHANHAELIRAPLLFADDGPVACLPQMLKWLGKTPGPVAVPPSK